MKGAGMPKILVADDSIAVRKVAERLLTEAGLGVTLAANGEEALAYLAKERPDVVVSDVIMPDKSGYEVCAFVRGHATLASTPVLLISGIVNHEVTKQAESCRADGVLKKPFQGTSLKDRVLELIARQQETAPASVARPVSDPMAAPVESTTQMADQQQQGLLQGVHKLKELEEQLRAERDRSEELTKRLAESSEQLARAKTSEVQAAAERARVNDLQETLAKVEQQASRIPELEAALKAEQDAVNAFRQEAVHWEKASGRIAELESTLHAERIAAEQLVQQLAQSEQLSMQITEAEARLANAEQQTAELQRKIQDLEAELLIERRKGAEAVGHLQEMERVAMNVQEMEGLLTAERDRNGMLARRVTEAEQAAESATQRLEEMARKLGEIASLASQLGNGRGQS
jgi:DNA-binding response OmpR family regulator